MINLLLGAALSMTTHKPLLFPRPTGPYAVGTTAFHLVDASRTNELSAHAPHMARELMVQLWYPAEGNLADEPTALYAPDVVQYWKRKLKQESNVSDTEIASLDQIFVYAQPDVPVLKKEAPFPLLLFATGFGQMRTHNTALCEAVASHGYIVASIDHPGFSEQVTFPDGHQVFAVQQTIDTVEKEQGLQELLLADITFVAKELARLNDTTDSLVYKRCELSRMGIFGHSVGGSTALFATKRFPEIRAGVNLDGGILGNKELLRNFDKPFLHIIAEESFRWANMLKNLTDDQLAAYGFSSRAFFEQQSEKGIFMSEILHAHQTSDVYRVMIHGAGHMSFCDALLLKENSLLEPFLYLRFGIGTISAPRIVELTTRGIVHFFDTYLKNKYNATFESAMAAYPELEMQ